MPVQYPVIIVLGERGAGKTLLMTAIAVDEYNNNKRRIFSNYHLKGVPYDIITFKELIELPDYLTNAIVCLDELQVGADSYKTFSKSNEGVNTFVTQLRKRKVTLYYTTQVYTQIAKRVRNQTNYIMQVIATDTPGVSQVDTYTAPKRISKDNVRFSSQISSHILDLRDYFKYYDTDEIIHNDVNENDD